MGWLSESAIKFDLWSPLAEKSVLRHFRFQKQWLKSHITRKRYVIEQNLTLIKNRKSAIAFQNLLFYLTCGDATWRRNRRYVTSCIIQNLKKSSITRKRYVIEQKLTLITNRKSAIAFRNLPFHLTCFATWRRNRWYFTSCLIKNH